MEKGTHDNVFTGTSNGDKMGGEGADNMSVMCAVDPAFAHITCYGCRLLLQPDVL